MTSWYKHWNHWPCLPADNVFEPIPPEVMASIAGNAPLSIKRAALTWYGLLAIRGDVGFEYATRKHVLIKEVSLESSIDNPGKVSTKIVCELEVTPDMCDEGGILSPWSLYSLIDEGSAISLLLMRMVEAGEGGEHLSIGVSQTMNIFFHHLAPGPGSKITLISRSISTRGDVGCCKCEIWDTGKHRLIVTGTQMQMMPSEGREPQKESSSRQDLQKARL
ncbi:hypothetical protein CPB84DRAFT_86567 [Gymnopilus junonius]|uniref:Thioesterase domain-containing protein n=1 Tax=Gymnopilus junonius TaxID=109634 RepID=A0A9P5P3R7_GYMJU|nr:hypothetical protein CPB84DRAFT_86567 [Gymnopilus junonius]